MVTPIQLPQSFIKTYQADNQVPPLAGYNAFTNDAALVETFKNQPKSTARLKNYGQQVTDELAAAGFLANAHPPELQRFNARGQRIDQVNFHPSYHQLMAAGKAAGLTYLSWTTPPHGQLLRSALFYLHNQAEAGTACPLTMTHASVPALKQSPKLAKRWISGICNAHYDASDQPAEYKQGLTFGMGMTEKQGGSDVRRNTTTATPVGDSEAGPLYQLRGHKWFFSAPMSDGFLVLAQAPEGLSCFLMPRWTANHQRNTFIIQQLKDKLGDRANASAEVELYDAHSYLIGRPGHGIATILPMVMQTRLDCMLGSAGLVRKAIVEAIHYCRHRHAFGQRLVDQPVMTTVLADLAIASEAATALALATAAMVADTNNSQAQQLARLATPAGKYWVCKRTPSVINEAQECLGGNGYIETSILPRLYRQAPVNSIWEGSGNIQCLDVLRALQRQPETQTALQNYLAQFSGCNAHFDAHCEQLSRQLQHINPTLARYYTQNIALALTATALLKNQSPIADIFCQTRLSPDHAGFMLGTLPATADCAGIIDRAFPPL